MLSGWCNIRAFKSIKRIDGISCVCSEIRGVRLISKHSVIKCVGIKCHIICGDQGICYGETGCDCGFRYKSQRMWNGQLRSRAVTVGMWKLEAVDS